MGTTNNFDGDEIDLIIKDIEENRKNFMKLFPIPKTTNNKDALNEDIFASVFRKFLYKEVEAIFFNEILAADEKTYVPNDLVWLIFDMI